MSVQESTCCKICSSTNQVLLGSVNAGRVHSKNNKFPLGKSNHCVEYFFCNDCSFIYSPSWDNKDSNFWNYEIYNESYSTHVDPDFTGKRSKDIAPIIHSIIKILKKASGKNNFQVLDYGSGESLLGKILAKFGIKVDSYDPYSKFSEKPDSVKLNSYDLIIAIEVMEHAVSPIELVGILQGLSNEDGLILFTTKIRSEKNKDLNWPYIAPRNGHISIFSKKSLRELSSKFNMYYVDLYFFHIFTNKKIKYLDVHKLLITIIIFKINFHLKRLLSF